MITLLVLANLLTIYGWYRRYKNSLKGKYNFNLFDEDPTVESVLLLFGSLIVIGTILGLIIVYLP